SVAFSPDDTLLASGSYDKTIQLWDLQSHSPQGQPLKGHTGYVLSVAFSPDGTILISSSSNGEIILWNITTFVPLIQLPNEEDPKTFQIGPNWACMTQDGWPKTTGGELILWVPPTYRKNL
ncbi:WD40 repeat-like protein, partial [Clavulina sp. PMI_390]